MKTESIAAKERYDLISKIISEDSNAVNFLDGLVSNASRYVTHTANMQAEIRKNAVDSRQKHVPSFYSRRSAEHIASLDKIRKIYHDSLISRLYSLNRYLFQKFSEETPFGGIYSLEPSTIKDRRKIGDWAGYLVSGLKDK